METVQDSQLRGHGGQVEGARQQTGAQRRTQGAGEHRAHLPLSHLWVKIPTLPQIFKKEGDQRRIRLVKND